MFEYIKELRREVITDLRLKEDGEETWRSERHPHISPPETTIS